MSDGDEFDIGPESEQKTSLALATRDSWFGVGKKDKESVLQILDDISEDYTEVELTEAETSKLSRQLKKMAIGSSSFSPMLCQGADCPFASRCELVQMKGHPRHGKAPVDKQCLLEVTSFRDATLAYMQEYDVDPNNFTELGMVGELAEIEVLLWRLNMNLALPQNASLVIDQTTSIDPRTGEPVVQQMVSPLFEQKQKLGRRKTQLIKLMVGDRQEKYKKEAALKQKTEADTSSMMADVKKNLLRFQQELDKKTNSATIIDAEFSEPQALTPEDLIGHDEGESDK